MQLMLAFFFFLPLETFARSDRDNYALSQALSPRSSPMKKSWEQSRSSAKSQPIERPSVGLSYTSPDPLDLAPSSHRRPIHRSQSASPSPAQIVHQHTLAPVYYPNARSIKSAGASPGPRRSPRGTRSSATCGYALSRFGDPSALTRLRRGYTLSRYNIFPVFTGEMSVLYI